MNKWTRYKYLAVHLIFVATAFAWPQLAHATVIKSWAVTHEWELIICGLLIAIPTGTWLGVSIPPPRNYRETQSWPLAMRWLSGLVAGVSVAIFIGYNMNPLSIVIIPPAMLSSVAGTSFIVIWRSKFISQWENQK